jgi:hypothetical protein
VGFCENGVELSHSGKDGEFLDKLNNYQLFNIYNAVELSIQNKLILCGIHVN